MLAISTWKGILRKLKAQLDVTRSLSKPLNEANNRYDSIGYREHTAEEENRQRKNMNAARLNMTGKSQTEQTL